MSRFTHNRRPIEIEGVAGEDRDTLFILEAWYLDTKEEITDVNELDEIVAENYDEVYQMWIEDKICEAEDRYGMKGE